MALLDFLRDVGKHFTVNQMIGQGVGAVPIRAPEPGDLLHRVQLHAAAGLRLPPAVRAPRLRAAAGRQRPVGQHHHGGRADPQGARRRGLRPDLAAGGEGRRHQVRQDRVGHGLARRRPDQPVPALPVLLQVEDAVVGRYLRYFTFLRPRGDRRPRRGDGHASRAPRGPARALARSVCELVHGPAEAASAEQASRALFTGSIAGSAAPVLAQVVEEVPTTRQPRHTLAGGLGLVDVLAASGLTGSKGEARRVIAQGGVSVNDRREDDAGRGPRVRRPTPRPLPGAAPWQEPLPRA